jgi:hypothetical protein
MAKRALIDLTDEPEVNNQPEQRKKKKKQGKVKVEKPQCCANTAKGTRCTRRAMCGVVGYCKRHAQMKALQFFLPKKPNTEPEPEPAPPVDAMDALSAQLGRVVL